MTIEALKFAPLPKNGLLRPNSTNYGKERQTSTAPPIISSSSSTVRFSAKLLTERVNSRSSIQFYNSRHHNTCVYAYTAGDDFGNNLAGKEGIADFSTGQSLMNSPPRLDPLQSGLFALLDFAIGGDLQGRVR
ncbi:hypothetical protein DM860_016631 [Cuscuta australis]|uniref:Uncharacterized protein n=1 Tax=Cuscuta australis TaxID=267555 RepID=A0A328DNH4_9ASTE|nr:hypothetical protein DM860_016631 [Cuscuta australis]